MRKFLNFLNRHLAKILWSLVILVWVGVGVYYFSTTSNFPSFQSFVSRIIPNPTSIPSENFDETEFIIGNFQNWEEIGDSPDRYIVLTDAETGQVFPKVRVGFEFSTLFGHQEGKDATVFAVEKGEEETDYEVLYALKYFADEEIGKLINKGDWIKIYFQREKDKEINAKDENEHFLAHWLMIKRKGGKVEVEQELGRKIERPENP